MGAFSDTFERSTPNNWLFGLSNEYVRAPNGSVYEGRGIPVDVLLDGPFLPLADRNAGVDGWLEIAIEMATANAATTALGAPTASPSAATGVYENSRSIEQAAESWVVARLTGFNAPILQTEEANINTKKVQTFTMTLPSRCYEFPQLLPPQTSATKS
eukprot:scaffold4425_cov168-Amphora_coffeaeformis.AAC.10